MPLLACLPNFSFTVRTQKIQTAKRSAYRLLARSSFSASQQCLKEFWWCESPKWDCCVWKMDEVCASTKSLLAQSLCFFFSSKWRPSLAIRMWARSSKTRSICGVLDGQPSARFLWHRSRHPIFWCQVMFGSAKVHHVPLQFLQHVRISGSWLGSHDIFVHGCVNPFCVVCDGGAPVFVQRDKITEFFSEYSVSVSWVCLAETIPMHVVARKVSWCEGNQFFLPNW